MEVHIDPKTAPEFFYWVIPIASDIAKIGIAGAGMNTFQALDKFVEERSAVAIRKMAAPVVCSGTLRQFVEGRIARAGDAAGQAKPTTGGGIYTGGYGGMLAGIATAKSVLERNPDNLREYEDGWKSKFGREFRLQYHARNAFAKMTNEQLDKLFEMVSSSEIPKDDLRRGRFRQALDCDRKGVWIFKVSCCFWNAFLK